MLFAQFYNDSTFDSRPERVKGAIFVLSSTRSTAENCFMAEKECKRKGFTGYRLFIGNTTQYSESITRYKAIK